MKYINRKQTLIITGNTAQEFQTKLNEALADLAARKCKHDIQFNMAYGLCAYTIYDEFLEMAETIKDEYEQNGDTYKCYECPMFRPSDDRRVRYTTCARGVRKTYHCGDCCEWFYEALERGEIKLNEEECSKEKDTQ